MSPALARMLAAPVVCSQCGYAFARSAAQLAAGVPPHDGHEARLAAVLTGWDQDTTTGAWYCCMRPECRPTGRT
jgi:hypothetical protein